MGVVGSAVQAVSGVGDRVSQTLKNLQGTAGQVVAGASHVVAGAGHMVAGAGQAVANAGFHLNIPAAGALRARRVDSSTPAHDQHQLFHLPPVLGSWGQLFSILFLSNRGSFLRAHSVFSLILLIAIRVECSVQ